MIYIKRCKGNLKGFSFQPECPSPVSLLTAKGVLHDAAHELQHLSCGPGGKKMQQGDLVQQLVGILKN